MNYCSMNDTWVMVVASVLNVAKLLNKDIDVNSFLSHGFQWKQLVLPGFELLMGV